LWVNSGRDARHFLVRSLIDILDALRPSAESLLRQRGLHEFVEIAVKHAAGVRSRYAGAKILHHRIQDRYGHTVYRHDERECRGCDAEKWSNQAEPPLVDRREQVLDPMTAYQITSMMEGVVLRGTAPILRELGKPVAGKTGTTNEEKDAWFIGFTPDMVCGVYMGYDKPRHLSFPGGATGGHLAAPIVKDFLKAALADKPPAPFRVPPGIKLIRIDKTTGMRAGPNTEKAILEAFKPGTAPPDNYSVIGFGEADGRSVGGAVTPDADRAVRSGTGGLY